jgi:hypothetical protein
MQTSLHQADGQSVGASHGGSSFGTGDFYTKGLEIVNEVVQHLGVNAPIFTAPVDTTLYPDYPRVVKQPMDMGTIRSRLERRQYSNPQEFCDVSACMPSSSAFLRVNGNTREF